MARDVYKVIAEIDTTITTSQSNLTLHFADVPKTLVRTIIDVYIENSTTAGLANKMRLIVLPEDFGAPTLAAIGHNLDDDVPDEFIAHMYAVAPSDGTGNHLSVGVFRDMGGARKLDSGDSIILQKIGEGTSKINGYVTMFFKDA